MSKVLIRILVLVALIAWCDGTSRPFSRKKKKSKKHKAVTKEDSWSSLSSIDWMDMTSKEVRRYKRKKRKRKKASTTTSTTRGPSNDDNLVSLSVLYVGNVDVSVMKVYDTDTKRKRCKFHHIVSGDELVCDAELLQTMMMMMMHSLIPPRSNSNEQMARRALATWIRRVRQALPCKGVMILRYPVLCVAMTYKIKLQLRMNQTTYRD
eukprot:603885_1